MIQFLKELIYLNTYKAESGIKTLTIEGSEGEEMKMKRDDEQNNQNVPCSIK